ncbi:MAG: hypothetical protein FGF48_10435, partial [Candidatus Brockarchaeota archaeon]|nr:hypothetical protein [Candidatus Brockarchaeota archaeon]
GHTFFVNLWKRPSNEIESIYVGTQLRELYDNAKLYDIENSNASPYHLKLHGKKIGEVYSAKLTENNLGVYNIFSQMELNRVVALLRKGIIYLPTEGVIDKMIPLSTLSDLGAEIGPDVRQVHSTFKSGELKRGSAYKAFWGYDSNVIKTIRQKPNVSLEPKEQQANQARELWRKSGRLLLVERAWLNTYTVLATYLEEEALSNVWWPVKIGEDEAKILVLWLNSTFGFLLLMSMAEVTRGPWVKFKKEHLQEMPILDIRKLNSKVREHLLKLYDKICESEFKPLPEEFANPNARRTIDEGFNEALGLKFKMDPLYDSLSSEPMIRIK